VVMELFKGRTEGIVCIFSLNQCVKSNISSPVVSHDELSEHAAGRQEVYYICPRAAQPSLEDLLTLLLFYFLSYFPYIFCFIIINLCYGKCKGVAILGTSDPDRARVSIGY
jgi:hypothetical protein